MSKLARLKKHRSDDVADELSNAAACNHRHQIPEYSVERHAYSVEVESHAVKQRQHLRQLHEDLKDRAHNGTPCKVDGQVLLGVVRTIEDQRHDHCDVPRYRCGIRGEKSMVAVEHAEAPCGHDKQSRARKEDLDERDRE